MISEHADCKRRRTPDLCPGCLPMMPASEVSVGHIGDFVFCSMYKTAIEIECLFSGVM